MPSREQVKALLANRVLALAQFVAPDGRVHGNREWIGHTAAGGKVGVVINGPKIGFWQNFHSGQAGKSGLTLIRDEICGGDFKAAWQWAHDFIGEQVDRTPPPSTAPVESKPRERPGEHKSRATWLHAQPFSWDGPVGMYLRGRWIFPECFFGRPLGALRYHDNLWCEENGRHMGAMVAAIIDPLTGIFIGMHRTYLEPGPRGAWRKAALAVPKKVLGASLGGVIPLTKGASRRSLTRPADGESALLAEGIENALTVAQFHQERRTLAYIAAGNLASLELPPQLADIMLVRDRDGIAPAIDRARDRAVGRWAVEEGRAVSQWQPPRGFKDANDWWIKGGESNAA